MARNKNNVLEVFLAEKNWTATAWLALGISSVAVLMSLYHLFTAYFGEPTALAHRSLFLSFILVLTFLLKPLRRQSWRAEKSWPFFVDLFLVGLTIFVQVYLLWDIDSFQLRFGEPNHPDTIVGSIALLLVIEGARRTVGWPMVIITLFFVAHTVYGNYFPGILESPPTAWDFYTNIIFSDLGLYSLPLMVMSSYIILFLIFSFILLETGAGNFFIDLAYSLTGRLTGGPAKTAVVASALMGTLSGSGVANVAATGSFTIPLMKSVGYRPVVAGAIEACASTGGIITPPIMGAAAFLIAQFLAIPYLQVCIYGTIPAVLYFGSVFMMVHLEAKKEGLKPLAKEQLPSLLKTLAKGWHLLLSIFALIAFLVWGYTAMMAAFWAILLLFVLSFIRQETRLTPTSLLVALEGGATAAIAVGLACACAGIIIGSVYISGLGLRFANMVVALAGGELWLCLIFVMIASIILGMGMPPTAVYLTVVTIVAPALIELGVRPISAHLFCFYFGAISAITPPVCMAAFAAAAISGAKPMATGWKASAIGITAFIIPYMWIYNPALLMIGSALEIIWVLITGLGGILFLAAGVEGWLLRRICWLERVAAILAALLLIKPGLFSDTLGATLIALSLIAQKLWVYPKHLDGIYSNIFSPNKSSS